MKIGFQDWVQKDFQKENDLNMNTLIKMRPDIPNFNLDFRLHPATKLLKKVYRLKMFPNIDVKLFFIFLG